MKRKTDPLDSVAGQILENAKKSGLEINPEFPVEC
jgi:hypothetical protein